MTAPKPSAETLPYPDDDAITSAEIEVERDELKAALDAARSAMTEPQRDERVVATRAVHNATKERAAAIEAARELI